MREMGDALEIPHTSYAYYEDGYKRDLLPVHIVQKIAGVLVPRGVPEKEILALAGIEPATRRPVSRLHEIVSAPESNRIPVLGTAEGSEEGWSLWNGDVIDHVPRPPSLIGAPNAYACYVTGTSMEPRYHPGELIYVHPGKPVMIGSYVLVQARPRTDGEPPRAVVKRLARRLAQKIILEQYNPPKTFDVQLKDVISMHRIMGSGE